MGISSRAAMMLCMALKQTFSRATAHKGSGHMTRSSISRVMPNSLESGSATAAIPENMMGTATEAGQKDGAEVDAGSGWATTDGHGIAPAHARQDKGEDEEKQQRLHSHAQDEGQKLAGQHAQVAQKEAEEGLEKYSRVEVLLRNGAAWGSRIPYSLFPIPCF